MLHDVLKNWISSIPLFDLSPAAIHFLPRMMIAILCGVIIGFERELYNKAAGIKTLMLVSLGSTMFASISTFLIKSNTGIDETRIIAQIVSGMGFLGAGVILQNKGSIVGMTSAANIWFTGAIGCVIGIGEYELAITLSVISILFLIITRKLESILDRNYEDSRPHFYHLKADCDVAVADIYSQIQKAIKTNKGIIKHSSLKKQNGTKEVDIKYSCAPKNHEGLLKSVQALEGIINLDLDERNKEG